jgi:hypothetical protein
MNVVFEFRHMLALIASLQVHRVIIMQRLEFGVPMDTSDLETMADIDTMDASQKVAAGARVQELNGAKVVVLGDGHKKRDAINEHDVHTKGDSAVAFLGTVWHRGEANGGIGRLLPSGHSLKDSGIGPKAIISIRGITPFQLAVPDDVLIKPGL